MLAIHDLTQQIAQAQHDLNEAIDAARAAGVPWRVIDEAAGITSQSAHQRLSDPIR